LRDVVQGGLVSKGKKIVILVVLMILSSNAFALFNANGPPEGALFCSILTVGFLVSIFVVALSRSESRLR
jgi:hypothetical protein